MTTLLLDRRGLALKREGGSLALFLDGERHGTVPLHLIERVVMRSSVQLDSGLLAHLAGAGIGVLMLGGRHGRKRAVFAGAMHNDAARRIGHYRRYQDPEWRANWALRLVRHKLLNQLRLLRQAMRERPDLRKPLSTATGRLEHALRNLAEPKALEIERMRGIEGAAALAYFQGFTRLFPPSLGFQGRNRRPPRDPVNAVLSLGYTLLHFEAVQAAYGVGLDPLIGFYHELTFGRESLACDLIEPLRPNLDAWAWKRFRSRDLRVEDFAQDSNGCLLGKPGVRDELYHRLSEFLMLPQARGMYRYWCEDLRRKAARWAGLKLGVPAGERDHAACRNCINRRARYYGGEQAALKSHQWLRALAYDWMESHLQDLGFGRQNELARSGEPNLARDLAEIFIWYLEPAYLGWLKRRYLAARRKGEEVQPPNRRDLVRLFESRAARAATRGREITSLLHRWLIHNNQRTSPCRRAP